MKKISIIVASALVLGLSFTSCSGDDDSNDVKSIVGKWNFSTEKVSFGGQTISDGPYSDNEAGCNKDYIEFAATTAIEGDYWTDCELELYTSTYTRSGNTLTVTEDGDVTTVEVLSVNSNTLVLRTVEATEAGNINYDLTLTKA